MPVYEYTALDANGKNTSGIIDAESPGSAQQKLRGSSIYPVSIKEVYKTTASKRKWSLPSFRSFSRISQSELSMMTRQLSTLINAGFPLVSAISTLIPQAGSHAFKKILSRIKDSIEEGKSFAGSLSLYPEAFSSIYINMVRAAESSGTLEIVLGRLADILEKQQFLKNRIRQALAYPLIMTLFGSVILFVLITFIVPKITGMLQGTGQELPGITVALMTMSDILKKYWWLILIVIVAVIFGFRYLINTEKGRYQFDKTTLRLTVMGDLFRKIAVARFARTLSSLLENGVPMIASLEIVKNIVGNVIVADTISEAAKDVEKGHGLGKSLSSSDTFPYLTVQMILVGEQSGELEAMLKKIADIYEDDVETTITSLTTWLEPVIIVIMAVVVCFIILATLLPIMKLTQIH